VIDLWVGDTSGQALLLRPAAVEQIAETFDVGGQQPFPALGPPPSCSDASGRGSCHE
jgi:hypothetical protein